MMRGQPAGKPAARRAARAGEHPEDADRHHRIVPRRGGVPEAQLVGLVFVVPPELQEQELGPGARQLAQAAERFRQEDRPDPEPDLRQRRPADLARE
jgi:hypothetical protein